MAPSVELGRSTMVQLKIIDHAGKERVHELVDELTTVGRASGNVIQVTDEKASRHHFRIEKVGERFRLVDLGSTNGTRLNGIKLQGDVFLRPGDKIGLGKTVFIFDEANAPKPAPESAPSAAPAAAPTATPAKLPAVPPPPAPAPAADALALKQPQPDGPKYILKMLEGVNAGQVYELGTKPLTVGRHSSNTIQIIDDAVSSYHAEIAKEPIGYVVTDLGSTNGTRVKARQKPDFEKVVKTPLAVGMQIRFGKTTLEFQNIGKPVDDEALFGTVALEPDKLEAKLAEPARGVPMAVLVLLAVMVFGGVVAGVVYFGKHFPGTVVKGPDDKKEQPSDLSNKIANGDFTQGTDDEGNPRNFKIERGSPGVKVEVAADAAYDPESKDPSRLGLRINKSGKSASALTAVETASTFALEPGKVYEYSGRMRNDGDGLFGLRVTWIQGERKFSENPIVLKDTQEWKEKTMTLTPPPWAQRAKAGVFVQGKDGKTCFDDLQFREKPGAAPALAPAIKFGAIGIVFEGQKGMFTGTLTGDQVIEDGTLLLVSPDGGAVADLATAVEPQMKTEANGASFDGRIYDFAVQELTNYRIQALQSAQGVELRVAVDSTQDAAAASTPQLRFYVCGPVAQGDIEVSKPGGGSPEKIAGTEGSKTLSGVEEVLFNAGRLPQLDLLFAKPAEVELKREGKRRSVIISFKAEVQVSLAAESVGQKRLMRAALGDLRKSLEARKWGEAEGKLKPFRETFAARFLDAREEAAKVMGKLESEYGKSRDELRAAESVVQTARTAEAAEAAEKTVNRQREMWAGGDRFDFDAIVARIRALVKAGDEAKLDQEAEKLFQQADKYAAAGAYTVARSLLNKVVADFGKTKVAEKAKALLADVEAKERRKQEINALQDDLRAKVKNYLLMNEYKSAIEAIEKDKRYQDNRLDLTDINKLLEEWRKKVQ